MDFSPLVKGFAVRKMTHRRCWISQNAG